MRTSYLYIVIVVLIGGLFFTACNKSQKTPTPEDILAGKWRLIETATDDNNNKQLDPDELRTMDPKDIRTLAFHYDGSGVEEINYYGAISDFFFSWELVNGSQGLNRIAEGHDTIINKILTFSPLNMTLLDTLSSPTYSWYIYRKQ